MQGRPLPADALGIIMDVDRGVPGLARNCCVLLGRPGCRSISGRLVAADRTPVGLDGVR